MTSSAPVAMTMLSNMNMIFGDNMLKSFLNIFTNPFSNKTYIETESGLVNENGKFFNKMPNGYMSSNGRFIQQIERNTK
mgnify:CR=1 FL=1